MTPETKILIIGGTGYGLRMEIRGGSKRRGLLSSIFTIL